MADASDKRRRFSLLVGKEVTQDKEREGRSRKMSIDPKRLTMMQTSKLKVQGKLQKLSSKGVHRRRATEENLASMVIVPEKRVGAGEEQISDFGEDKFSTEDYVRNLFQTETEKGVRRHVTSLTSLRSTCADLQRGHVHTHHHTFARASREIVELDSMLQELRPLLSQLSLLSSTTRAINSSPGPDVQGAPGPSPHGTPEKTTPPRSKSQPPPVQAFHHADETSGVSGGDEDEEIVAMLTRIPHCITQRRLEEAESLLRLAEDILTRSMNKASGPGESAAWGQMVVAHLRTLNLHRRSLVAVLEERARGEGSLAESRLQFQALTALHRIGFTGRGVRWLLHSASLSLATKMNALQQPAAQGSELTLAACSVLFTTVATAARRCKVLFPTLSQSCSQDEALPLESPFTGPLTLWALQQAASVSTELRNHWATCPPPAYPGQMIRVLSESVVIAERHCEGLEAALGLRLHSAFLPPLRSAFMSVMDAELKSAVESVLLQAQQHKPSSSIQVEGEGRSSSPTTENSSDQAAPSCLEVRRQCQAIISSAAPLWGWRPCVDRVLTGIVQIFTQHCQFLSQRIEAEGVEDEEMTRNTRHVTLLQATKNLAEEILPAMVPKFEQGVVLDSAKANGEQDMTASWLKKALIDALQILDSHR